MESLAQFLFDQPIKKIPEILEDYETLRGTGAVGNCALRVLTEEYMCRNGIEQPSALMMEMMGLEAYRLAARVLMGKGYNSL